MYLYVYLGIILLITLCVIIWKKNQSLKPSKKDKEIFLPKVISLYNIYKEAVNTGTPTGLYYPHIINLGDTVTRNGLCNAITCQQLDVSNNDELLLFLLRYLTRRKLNKSPYYIEYKGRLTKHQWKHFKESPSGIYWWTAGDVSSRLTFLESILIKEGYDLNNLS